MKSNDCDLLASIDHVVGPENAKACYAEPLRVTALDPTFLVGPVGALDHEVLYRQPTGTCRVVLVSSRGKACYVPTRTSSRSSFLTTEFILVCSPFSSVEPN